MTDISAEQLYRLLENNQPLLFDIRSQKEFENGHIEGKTSFPTLNISYKDLIEKGDKKDSKESISYYIQEHLSQKLPKNEKIIVVCNRGRSSAIVSDILRNLGYDALSLIGGIRNWGNFYIKKEIIATPDLSIFQIIRISRGCLSYVIISNGMATVIDPLRQFQPYLELFEKLNAQPQFILDTHVHADHISGGKELAEKFGIPYYFHPYDGIHPIDMIPAKFSYEFSWLDKIYSLGKIEIKALHIPGHTLGNQAFLINNQYLFSGDSIFIGSIARPDLGGHAQAWTTLHYDSLRKLIELPDNILVLPSHFNSLSESNADHTFCKTLGELKKQNEGLLMVQKSLKDFSEYILNNLPHFAEEYMDIKRINLGLLTVDEDKAIELELGKNICAVQHHAAD